VKFKGSKLGESARCRRRGGAGSMPLSFDAGEAFVEIDYFAEQEVGARIDHPSKLRAKNGYASALEGHGVGLFQQRGD